MRRASVCFLLLLFAAAGCRKKTPPSTATDASVVVDAQVTTAATKEPDVEEAPLAWGTRPAKDAELYVALDGFCASLEVKVLRDAVILQHDTKALARLTDDGVDAEIGEGFAKAVTDFEEHTEYHQDSYIENVGGRVDDLWVKVTSPGSVFREAQIFERKSASTDGGGGGGDGKWKLVAPLGVNNMHYTAPEPLRDAGSLGTVFPAQQGEAGESKLLAFDLPKGVSVGKLFPPRARQFHALDTGDVLAITNTADMKSSVLLLAPEDTTAHAMDVPKAPAGAYFTFRGRSLKTFRLIAHDSESGAQTLYRLTAGGLTSPEKKFVREEVENAPEWRTNGPTLQHLVGAGYQDVVLPSLPISGAASANVKFSALSIAADGEALVTVRWRTNNKDEASGAFALLRSRRPKQTLKCSEHSFGEGPLGVFSAAATVSGIESSPPLASSSCTTPFVIAFRYRHEERVPKEFPKALAVLSKGEDAGAVPHLELIHVVSSGRRVVGARAPSMADADHAAALLKKELKIEPEIVCANPAPAP